MVIGSLHRIPRLCCCAIVLFVVTFAGRAVFAAGPSIQVEALFPNTAVLKVDGHRKMLRKGQSFRGVTLVSAEAGSAIVEYLGQRQTLQLSTHIGSSFAEVKEKVVTLTRDSRNQYQTNIAINGRTILALVDTGATTVALSGSQARSLGIDFYGGQVGKVSTASGTADAYSIMLQSVSVGGIEVNNVRASVIDGDYPNIVLLGMTYLSRFSRLEIEGRELRLYP